MFLPNDPRSIKLEVDFKFIKGRLLIIIHLFFFFSWISKRNVLKSMLRDMIYKVLKVILAQKRKEKKNGLNYFSVKDAFMMEFW